MRRGSVRPCAWRCCSARSSQACCWGGACSWCGPNTGHDTLELQPAAEREGPLLLPVVRPGCQRDVDAGRLAVRERGTEGRFDQRPLLGSSHHEEGGQTVAAYVALPVLIDHLDVVEGPGDGLALLVDDVAVARPVAAGPLHVELDRL